MLRKAPLIVVPLAPLLLSLPLLAGQKPKTQPAQAEPKTPIRIDDLYRFDGPTTPALSPDGKRLAYARHWFDPRTRQERYSLWLVDGVGRKARALEEGEPDARRPVFSPDGKWIAFLSTRARPKGWKGIPPTPPESDTATDLWLIPTGGGTAVPLAGADKPYGRVFNDGFYGRVAFSPDGRRLVFVADEGKAPRTPPEVAAQVFQVREDQGEGYTGYGAAQVWVAELHPAPEKSAARTIQRVTPGDLWYGDPQWSPDGSFLVVHANRTRDQESVRYSINKNYDLWAIDLKTGKLRQLTIGPGPEVSPRFSPDGKRLACLSIPRKGSHRDVFNLALVTLGEGGPRTTVLFNHHGPGADKPPHPAPSFPLLGACWDGDGHLVYNAGAGVSGEVVRLDLRTGKGQLLGKDAFEVKAGSPLSRMMRALEMVPGGNVFLRSRLRSTVRVVTWDNGEGRKIEGVLNLPPDKVAKKPYPLIVYPHGGPHSRSTEGFNFTAEVFAAHGYAVFQPNFRGSAGYGQKFIDADRGDFGGGDMRDILTGVDHLIKEGLIDRDRQFVYGVSYGGFMTCWLVGHTNQFRAAVAQNAVTDLNMMWSLSDLQSWTEWEFGGKPWEVPAAMRKHSPLTYAANVRTPTLVLHSVQDRRCPLPMGRAFHRALLSRGVPTGLVLYPGEGHGIRQPRHREDVLRRTLEWFAQHDRK
jgi:dipeptidyl aminopeptidase/acylaminoacyl peptidase